MKIQLNRITVVTLFLIYHYSSAWAHTLETPYHCPSFTDIKYDISSHHIYADTLYNGQATSWSSEEFYFGPFNGVEKFAAAHLLDCSDSDCRIGCEYTYANNELRLELMHGNYKITRSGSGNWSNGVCEANNPEQCMFYVSPRY